MCFCEQRAHRLCREDTVKILAVFLFLGEYICHVSVRNTFWIPRGPQHFSLKQDLAFKSNRGQRLFLLGVIHVSLPVSVWVFLCDSKLTLGVNLSVCLCLLAMSWQLVHGVPSVFP